MRLKIYKTKYVFVHPFLVVVVVLVGVTGWVIQVTIRVSLGESEIEVVGSVTGAVVYVTGVVVCVIVCGRVW